MDVLELLDQNEHTELLRFITAGSVDDGKSTLIGRLLYEAKGVFADQLDSVRKASVRRPVPPGELDFSLFTDGLKAEREQSITIDVAYRYFSTPRRKFIIADTPGHEQYTRNMVTGASTANLMVILIDATKGLLVQSKRHAFIASLLGIQHIIVAVNKMDLVDFKQDVFNRIREDFTQFSAKLSARDVIFIPCSALKGDNIVMRSTGMPWYQGPTLLHHLETLHITSDRNMVDLRFPVQYVCRPDAGFRGYMGTVASGILRPDQEIMVLPSGERSRIKALHGPDGEIAEAFPPMSCCVVLEDERDVSRGCMLVYPNNVPQVDTNLEAMLVWMGQEPLRAGHPYVLKHITSTSLAEVSVVRYRIDIQTLHRQNATTLAMNEIGRVVIAANHTVTYDPYVLNRVTGGFILIDRLTNNTVGAGMILPRDQRTRPGARALADGQVIISDSVCSATTVGSDRSVSGRLPRRFTEAPKTDRETSVMENEKASQNLIWHGGLVSPERRAELLGQRGCVVWLTGLSGSGKSTLARAMEHRLIADRRTAYVLDGDNLRHGLNRDLGFSPEDRNENIRRVGEVAALMADAGLITIAAFISPYRAARQRAREATGTTPFIEVFLDVPLEICRQRDPKGLYAKALAGSLDRFTGIDAPYEPPEKPEVVIDTAKTSVQEGIEALYRYLEEHGVLRPVP